MISIIIPTLNEEKYIEKTLKQYIPYKKKYNLEIIVSDGGSTDNTLKLAKKYADKVVKKKGKQNIPIGRNYGAKFAKGELLFITDADVIIPNIDYFFRKVLKKFNNKNIVGATTRLYVYPEQETVGDIIFHFILNTLVRASFFFRIFSCRGECQIVRKKAFLKVNGYTENLVVGEDSNLFFKLNHVGKLVYLNNLKIFHSPRRFRKWGYLKVWFIYIREGFFVVLGNKSFLKKWPVVR